MNTHFVVGLNDGRCFRPMQENNDPRDESFWHWLVYSHIGSTGSFILGNSLTENHQSLDLFYRWRQAKRAGKTTAPFAIAFDYPKTTHP